MNAYPERNPTDSIPLVKRRADAIRALLGATREWTPSLEHCMFDAVQLRTMRLTSISFFIAALSTIFAATNPSVGGSVLAATPEIAPTPTVPAAAAEQGKDVVHQLNNAFAKVFETVAPSVVIIEISKKNDNETSAFEDLFFQGPPDESNPRRNPRNLQPIQSEGSGFIVRPDGYIFTNFHVVEAADKIDVKLKDGREFSAKVVGTDQKTDIAVIKIEAKDLPVVQSGDSDAVRVGQFAFAIGAPFKLDYTFTYGVVSGKGRSKLLTTSGYSISDYLQTDASINPGNSGGPLCDIDGKVIGMNTLINGINRGLGFAIPINMAKEIGEELNAGRKIMRPWLGIRIETLGDDPSIRDLFKGIEKGVVVRTIEADAPAYKSDLRPFDVITQVDGKPVTDVKTFREALNKADPKRGVLLYLDRKGSKTFAVLKAGGAEAPNDR